MVKSTLVPALASSSTLEKQRTTVNLVGATARYSPQRLGASLGDLVPAILALASKDDPELREGCLQTCEVLVLRCPVEITSYLNSLITLANELVKYDPVCVCIYLP